MGLYVAFKSAGTEMDLFKELANPSGEPVMDTIPCPEKGQKVRITDWEFFNKRDIPKLSKLFALTIYEIHPIVISDENGDHRHWEYEIYTLEAPNVLIPSGYYRIVN